MRRKNLLKLTSAVLAASMLLTNPSITSFIGNSVNQVQAAETAYPDIVGDGWFCTVINNGTEASFKVSDAELLQLESGTLTIPDTVKRSDGVEIPVTTVANYGAKNISKLRKVVLGKNVTTIGEYAFMENESLLEVDASKATGLKTIEYYAFNGCTNMHTFKFAAGTQLTTVGYQAFDGCASLRRYSITSYIADGVFTEDEKEARRTSFTYHGEDGEETTYREGEVVYFTGQKFSFVVWDSDGVRFCNIDDQRVKVDFHGYYVLEDDGTNKQHCIEIIDGLGNRSVLCVNFVDSDFVPPEKTYPDIYGDGWMCRPENNGTEATFWVYSEALLKLDNGVLTIPDAVKRSDGLKIPVTKIQDRGVAGIDDLKKVILGKNVTTIVGGAFQNDSALEVVDASAAAGLKTIGTGAFRGCTNLTEISFAEGTQLTTVGISVFEGCPNFKTYVQPYISSDAFAETEITDRATEFWYYNDENRAIPYKAGETIYCDSQQFSYSAQDWDGIRSITFDGKTIEEDELGKRLWTNDGTASTHTLKVVDGLGNESVVYVQFPDKATEAPTTQAPTTQAPTTEKATEAPTTEAPDTEAPVISYKGQKLKNGGNYKFYIEKDEEPEIFFSDNKEMQSLYCDSDLLPLKNLNSFSYPFGHYLVTHGPHVLTLIDASGNKTAVTLDFAVTPTATTQAPTTQAPTTEKATTQAPTTQAPTTQAPTTEEPDTVAPMISYKGEPLKNGQKYKFNIAEGEEPTLDFGDDKGLKSLYVGEDALPIKNPISFSYVLSHQYATYGERTYTLTDYAGNKTTVTIEFSVIPATTQAPTTEKATQAPTTQAPTTEKVTEAPTTQAPTTQAPTTEAPDTTLPGISYKGQKLENGGSYKFTIEENEQPSIFFSDNKGLANIYRGTDCVPANGSTGFYLELGYYLATHGPHALSVVDTSGNETKVTVEFATTQAPTTQAPTTAAPTTEKVTVAPTTQTPTTEKVTQAPTTQAPTTAAPTTEKVTVAPTTEKVTETPTTAAPTTEKVTTESETEQPIVDVEPDKQVTKLKTVYYKNKIKLSFDTSKIKKLRVNGKVVKSGKQLKKDGKYVVEFTDVNDNVSVGTYVIDTKKPVIKTKRVSGKLKMTVKDANLKSVTVKGKKQKVKNGTTTVTFKKKGKYVVKAIDAAGNLKKVTIKVK